VEIAKLQQQLGEGQQSALYTKDQAAAEVSSHLSQQHSKVVDAMAQGDTDLAVRLMQEHLEHVQASLTFDRKIPSHDVAVALS
jgi:DNA-binding FadR family transcriptional regulator